MTCIDLSIGSFGAQFKIYNFVSVYRKPIKLLTEGISTIVYMTYVITPEWIMVLLMQLC